MRRHDGLAVLASPHTQILKIRGENAQTKALARRLESLLFREMHSEHAMKLLAITALLSVLFLIGCRTEMMNSAGQDDPEKEAALKYLEEKQAVENATRNAARPPAMPAHTGGCKN